MNMAHLKFILDKMEKTTSYYTYSGRETQPPCNQGNLLKGIDNCNISSVVEFQRWWVLKSKIFGQESTYSKEI